MHYVREFEAKWLHGGMHSKEPLIGSADIQSSRIWATAPRHTQQVVLRFVAVTLLPMRATIADHDVTGSSLEKASRHPVLRT